MQIFVKLVTQKTITIRCSPDDQLNTIKSRLYDRVGFPPDLQRLIYVGKQLEDDRKLSDYNIQKVTLLAL